MATLNFIMHISFYLTHLFRLETVPVGSRNVNKKQSYVLRNMFKEVDLR